MPCNLPPRLGEPCSLLRTAYPLLRGREGQIAAAESQRQGAQHSGGILQPASHRAGKPFPPWRPHDRLPDRPRPTW